MQTPTWDREAKGGRGSAVRTYFVLHAAQLPENKKIEVSAAIMRINTGADAEKLPWADGWACQRLDTMGRVYVVKFKGAEVALLYKRQTAAIDVAACDPVPEGAIKEADDVWTRLDLLGASARKTGAKVKQTDISAQQQLVLAEKELAIKDQRIDSLEIEVRRLVREITQQENELQEAKKLSRKALSGLTDVGIEPYSPGIGTSYDNRKQEATARMPGEPANVGKILNVSRVGFLFKKKILVKARVTVGRK